MSQISVRDSEVILSNLKVVTSNDDLPPASENVIFLIPVRVSQPDGSIRDVLEAFVGYLSDEEYGLGHAIYDNVYGEAIGWDVDVGTIWIPITE